MRKIKPPNKVEWDTSALSAKGRAYLDDDLSFEKIATQVFASAKVISNRIEPYKRPPRGEEDGRQIVFVVRVELETCDLLYNARDGMRGRYWQSPDHGFGATKDLISQLMLPLLDHAKSHPPTPPENCAPMSAEDIEASLESISAKVWPREIDDNGRELLKGDQLKVLRWENNEKFGWWRKSPISGDLDIKGALIGADRTEYIPEEKRDRSCQIHKFGFA